MDSVFPKNNESAAPDFSNKSDQYENLFKHANDAILVIEPESERVINANDKACEMYGFEREDFIGRSIKSISENIGHGEKQLQKLLDQGTYQEFESVQFRADGTPIHLLINAAVIEYEGKPAVLSINRDVTARKQMESDLREREQHLFSVTNAAQDAIVSADNRGRIIFWNDGARKIFGYTEQEVVGKSLSILMPERYREMHNAGMRRHIETGEKRVIGQTVELHGLRKDESEFPLELSLGVWETAAGKYFTGIMRDITERRRSEQIQKWRASEAALRAEIGLIFAEGSESLETNLKRSAEAIVNHLDAAFARIWTLNEAENVLELQASAGIYTHTDGAHARVPVGKFKIGLIAEEARPHFTNDVLKDARIGDKKWARENKLISFAGYPLMIDGKQIGVVAMFARNELFEETHEALANVALIIAQNIERKRAAERLEKSERQYRYLAEGIMHHVWTAQPDGKLDYVNRRTLDYFGTTMKRAINDGWLSVVHPDDLPNCVERWSSSLRTGEFYEVEFRLLGADGVYRWHLGRATAGLDSDGKVIKWFGTNSDIHDKKFVEEELQKNLSLLASTFESTADGILVVDVNNNIVIFNRKFAEMWNMSEEALQKQVCGYAPLQVLEQIKDVEDYIEKNKNIDLRGQTIIFDEIELKDGRIYERYSQPQKLNEQVVGRVFSFRDVTERRSAERQLFYDAFHDGLTGLANRTLFMDHLRMTIERAKRNKSLLFAVLFLDFDRFKVVNDSLGHAAGDNLLKLVAHRLEAALRPGDLTARLGGDEFTILLSELSEENDAVRIAERIQIDLKTPFEIAGREIFISASVGIKLGGAGQNHAEDMLRDADIAMYRAKAKGRAQYQIFDAAMHEQASKQLQLETEMRRALEREEFEIHYQPIINLAKQALMGFEALVRWRHKTRGMISPLEFIPAAEENNLILPLGAWILRKSCRQMRDWQTANPAAADLTISVNLSCKQFLQHDLAEQIAQTLAEANLDPRSLKLEITESHVMENSEQAIVMMNRLHALGVELSIDDFGTGYSSLSYLHRLPASFLKIDRSFVTRIMESSENSEIVSTIIKLAHNLKMRVVAEGIETAGQLAHLKNLNCEYGQGYFFAKPLEAAAAEKFIRETAENSASIINRTIINAENIKFKI